MSQGESEQGGVDFFAADIHLSPHHPRRTLRFFDFLQVVGGAGRALYLLGDIFDIWLGDDTGGEFGGEVCKMLREVAGGGVKIYLQHGNRDFLIGKQFAAAAGGELINDNHKIDGGILLTHGDMLAADNAYRVYRAVVRSALARRVFGLLPASYRAGIAAKLRTASDAARRRPVVKESAAAALLDNHNCQMLIHGHLHNPCNQTWQSNGKTYRRLCLPAWEDGKGGYARIIRNEGNDDKDAAVAELISY